MKRIINGKTYNVHTATTVFEDGPAIVDPGGHSFAYWGLYQTRYGEFFKVTVQHDGEATKFEVLTDLEAQALLEKYANHLVEQYFGEMPEGGAAERRLTIRIPGNLADRIESLAKAQGMSLNTYAMRCFERCAAADGQPAVQG
ncbi:toxin-antitoxin system HicB family antitoxin [Burkholderia vietnamiensis]|uniref:toxin-antitoxin system HicB family antitoxin n=1 Tax=Burkholderia vietnamiensis TaxID=60552 RepID=UPI00075634EC|nr:toxin-antitoxin system HicB family antitoxin [Burkholderia vietnamiensis]KVR84405.1 hypothetical protein WK27_18675 [Burkholderia vietnamiensis]MCA8073554.1 toxin-antitoxin system HicB family antitoxin [Burkholderia vietnamiensis]